mmetsp:Transcript_125743/g.402470  ORF Transcript_125743/g.402470 Transcript_125743/m.402470 type:complete len:234 (-) Transcript_125743:395-1096(-)
MRVPDGADRRESILCLNIILGTHYLEDRTASLLRATGARSPVRGRGRWRQGHRGSGARCLNFSLLHAGNTTHGRPLPKAEVALWAFRPVLAPSSALHVRARIRTSARVANRAHRDNAVLQCCLETRDRRRLLDPGLRDVQCLRILHPRSTSIHWKIMGCQRLMECQMLRCLLQLTWTFNIKIEAGSGNRGREIRRRACIRKVAHGLLLEVQTLVPLLYTDFLLPTQAILQLHK